MVKRFNMIQPFLNHQSNWYGQKSKYDLFSIYFAFLVLSGKHVISSGHDKTLRLWDKTQEPLVLDDEREQEREQAEEDQLATGDRQQTETDTEAGLPSKKTAQTERSAERLMEAIM